MEMRKLAANGPEVSALGLGCMGMSDFYGPADRKQCIATIHKALELGFTFFNTGDFYGMGHNEMLLAEALSGGRRDKAFISVKYGAVRDPSGGWLGFDCKPSSTKNFLAYTLKRLNTDYIDLYEPCRVPETPIEEIVGGIADLVKAGYVRHIGLSEAGAETVRRAHKVHPITALEAEYSIFDRHLEREVLPTLTELGIGLVAYGVLSRGLITDAPKNTYSVADFRNILPRFQKENFEQNCRLIDSIREIAAAKHVTVTQLATAWVLSRGANIIPLIGTTKPERLATALEATRISFTADELAVLDRLHEGVAGTRYPQPQMAHVNR